MLQKQTSASIFNVDEKYAGETLMQGWLKKKGHFNSMSWQKRWFVLKEKGSHRRPSTFFCPCTSCRSDIILCFFCPALCYYTHPGGSRKGFIDLEPGINIVPSLDRLKFSIVASVHKEFEIQAETDESLEEWCNKLKGIASDVVRRRSIVETHDRRLSTRVRAASTTQGQPPASIPETPE